MAKCPHLEVEEGCGGDEQYPFSLLVSCRPVQVLEHIQRQGIYTRKSKSGTFGPNQELNQVAGSELLLAFLPILGSCSAKGFGQSHVASAVLNLFALCYHAVFKQVMRYISWCP